MCDGYIVYQGDPKMITNRLQRMNITIPQFVSPTDFFMKIIDKDEIKIEYEKSLENEESDPEIIDQLFKERLGKLIKLQMQFDSSSYICSTENTENPEDNENIEERKDNNLSEPFLGKKFSLKYSTSLNQRKSALDHEAKSKNQKRGFIMQIILLMYLKMSFYYRQPKTYYTLIGQGIIGNTIFFVVYANLEKIGDDTLIAIQDRMGLCYLLVMNGTFSGLGSVLLNFITQKKLFKKDKDSRLYDEFPFYFTELSYLIPLYFLAYIVVVVLYYVCLDVNTYPDLFSTGITSYFFIFIGSFLSGQSFSALLGSIADKMTTVSIIAPLVIAPLSMCSGFLANLRSSTLPIQIISYISSIRFSFQGLALNEFRNYQEYIDKCMTYAPCVDDPSKSCHVPVPESTKALCDPRLVTDFIESDIMTNVYFILAIFLGLRMVGYVIFKIKSSFGQIQYKKNAYLRNKLESIRYK